jgi:hypothetical protein
MDLMVDLSETDVLVSVPVGQCCFLFSPSLLILQHHLDLQDSGAWELAEGLFKPLSSPHHRHVDHQRLRLDLK